MSAPTFDARPLTEPVDRATVRDYVRRARADGRFPSFWSANTISIVVIAGIFVVVGVVFIAIFAAVVASIAASVNSQATPLIFLVPVVFVGGIMVFIAVAALKGMLGTGNRLYRLDRFAQANGMTFLPKLSAPALPGMIFNHGGARESTDLVRGDRPRFVEFANYQYTTGSGKSKTTHRWGYVAVKLDVPLPNIVLDATSNNALFGSNLPVTFRNDQRLSLEGDFDEYFTLYCPEGYERDALYLFTPDIMARFIDNAAALDVEIVDDWLFLYGKRPFSTLDPATWAWLFSVVGALLDKFAQWGRWRDERLRAEAAAVSQPFLPLVSPAGAPGMGPAAPGVAAPFAAPVLSLRPPPGVAPPGRRLSRRVPWVALIVIGLFLLLWLFGPLLFGMVAFLR